MPDSTLISNIRRHPSSSMSKADSALKTPPLVIRTSPRGTRSKICCAPALVPTSAVMPRAPSSAATASTRAASNPFTMTSAPARPSISAIALPIPAVEPVTSAMRPVRSIFMSSFPDPFLAAGERVGGSSDLACHPGDVVLLPPLNEDPFLRVLRHRCLRVVGYLGVLDPDGLCVYTGVRAEV